MSALSRQAPRQQPGSQPAVMSLQREVGIALDANVAPDTRAASLSKLHAALATHKISRPSVAVALLPWFLSSWPRLVACLWDSNPQLSAAVAPLLGLVGGLVASSRAAAVAAEDTGTAAAGTSEKSSTVSATAPGAPPVPPPGLLFDWLLPLLTGKVSLPTGMPAPVELQQLVCKTLVYALQQLPCCTTAQTTGMLSTTAAAHMPTVSTTEPTGSEADPASADEAVSSVAAVKVSQSSSATEQQQQKAPALLIAPVPPAAAQQLHKHAQVTLAAVQELLESAATPSALLSPLLQLLLEVFRVDVSVVTGTVLRDLLDLLLGWSLEPGLQPTDKQLITRVLSSCKQQWLAEPSLLQDVSSKLLTDLQQQLSLMPAAADSGDAVPPAGLEQQPHEEQQKFLTLMSCLVAILCAAVHESSCQEVVTGTAQLLLAAHTRFSSWSKKHEDFAACSAAVNLAGLMLVLCRSAAAAQQAVAGASDTVHSSGTSKQSSADVDTKDGKTGATDEIKDVMFGVGCMWRAAVQTVQLQLLTADDATALLDSMKATLLAFASVAPAELSERPNSVEAGHQQQHPQTPETPCTAGSISTMLRSMPQVIFVATSNIRCCGMAEVQSAAAALYTTSLAVAAPNGRADKQWSLLSTVLAEVALISNLLHKAWEDDMQHPTTDGVLKVQGQGQQQQKSPQQCTTASGSGVSSASPGLSSLIQQQLVSILLFDLEILQAWIHQCVVFQQQQQQQSSRTAVQPSRTLLGGDSAACIAAQVSGLTHDVVFVVCDLLQQLLQQSSGDDIHDILTKATAVLDKVVAYHQAVAATECGSGIDSISDSSNNLGSQGIGCLPESQQLVQPILTCVKQLMQHMKVKPSVQCLAVSLLPRLLLGQVQQRPHQQQAVFQQPQQQQQMPAKSSPVAAAVEAAHMILDDTPAVWHRVVELLASAADSQDASVRTSAVNTAAGLAAAVWQQPTCGTKHQNPLRHLPALMHLLAAACSDLSPAVAAVAQAAVAKLAIPAYMLAVAKHGGWGANSSVDSWQQIDADAVGVSAAISSRSDALLVWLRAAALQPQQRLFKPVQLAQLFELLFQASPLLLQRRSAQSIRQPPQQLHQAQADALFRLAQGLPPLPAAAQHSKLGNTVPLAEFDSLHSDSAVRWLLLQEAARHCVNARLRTHFGTAPQSFAALERVINSTLIRLQTDDSPAAGRHSWQQQLMRQLQAVLPQQQQQQQPLEQQQQQAGQEPQLLQAPVGGLVSRSAPTATLPQGFAPAASAETCRAVEQQRLQSEASAQALLDFMWALEVNIQSAAEGSLLRANVSKSVMAFFAGNKKVCEDWFARAREALISLSAAAGSVQHTVYHSIARLRELESGLRNLTAQYRTQQQQLQQQQQAQQQQPISSRPTAAAAAAAAAITGLVGQQSERGSRDSKQQGKHTKQPQQQQDSKEQRRLRSKQPEQSPAADSAGRTSDNTNKKQTTAAAATQEKLAALQRHYESSVLRLSSPVLSTLVLLADALIASGQAAAVTGLQSWAHDAFLKVWKGVSSLYALDISFDVQEALDTVDEQAEGQQAASGQMSSTMLLLTWLSGAAAQADGRLEAAVGLYQDFLQSQACQVPIGACLQGFIIEQMASCYAAAGDWQGLAKLSSREAMLGALQLNSTTSTIGAHHWVLAGSTAAKQLQQWQTHAFPSQVQQPSHPSGQRSSLVAAGDAQSPHLVPNMLQQQLTGLTAAEQVILRALQVSNGSTSPAVVPEAQQRPQRGRGRGRGRGRPGRQAAEAAQQAEALQQPAATTDVMADLRTELQQLTSNPLHLSSAISGSTPASLSMAVFQPSGKLQQLVIMQLLLDSASVRGVGADDEHTGRLQTALAGLVSDKSQQQLAGRYDSSGSSRIDAWSGLLTSSGKLRQGACGAVRDVMPLVQVLAARDSPEQPIAGSLVLREALLASHRAECTGTLQRLLQLAETSGVDGPDSAEHSGWLQLVKSKLLLPSSGESANTSTAQDAVVAHLRVLQPFWPLLSEDSICVSSRRSGSSAAVAAAYLSLAELLRLGAAAPAGDWEQLLHSRWQQLQQQQAHNQHMSPGDCATDISTSALVASTAAFPASQLPATACCTAAVAASPTSPAAWKAFGDMLYQHATKPCSEAEHTNGVSVIEHSVQQQQQVLYTAACNGYSRYLATAVHAQALSSPEQGLGVLLRLLHVAMEHGDALCSQLQQVFETVPVAAWQVLTPQLLGLLQHSSTAVRALVQQLLKGLAVVVPSAVLYPLVVEVRAAEEAGEQPSTELSEVLSELQCRHPRLLADACAMASALAQLTVTPREAWAGILSELGVEINRKLLALQADAVRQSKQGLTLGKRRELLAKRYHTVMAPVLSVLQQHLAVTANAAPSSSDESAFRRDTMPKLQALAEQLQEPPAELLRVLEEPSSTPSSETAAKAKEGGKTDEPAAGAQGGIAAGGWEPLKQLQQQLAQQLRQHVHLELSAVAPQLAALRNTTIPLPADDMTASTLPSSSLRAVLGAGVADSSRSDVLLEASDGTGTRQGEQQQPAVPGGVLAAASEPGSSWLRIAGFDKTVLVLPTKTRPKRLRLLADDGSVHAFLLKGKDDLRVDQRVMQFIRTANALLTAADTQATSNLVSGCATRPRLRPYSVTPFGRRAGLVQWVRHTTSLYGLVRNWQTATAERYRAVAAAREVPAVNSSAAGGAAAEASSTAAEASSKEAESSKEGVVLPLMVATRPVDAFYARLLPALQAAGVPVGAPRKSWPVAALRSAFLSLQRESPRNLLHQQLLSSSESPASWWCSQQRFSVSAATGSMIGWLLGLGDRHLDNLLLDTDTGELLHIDFSVCFDKGASLGVPEVVPFRLTQMMQVALGPGGLAGTFSVTAGHVLSVLRQSSDLISSLLALLLSDPAVDWSVEREAHAAKKDQDTAVSLKLFASRIEELRAPLLSGLAVALPTVGNGLAALVSYGEAHVYMQQMKSQAAAARSRAAAARTALAEASAGEVKALMDAANARDTMTAVTADYRRLCGLAASCITSAVNWLTRHEQTLQTLLGTPAGSPDMDPGLYPRGVQEIQGLVAQPMDWDLATCDRPLMLAGSNDTGSLEGLQGSTGILQQAMHPLIAVTASSSLNLAALLPADVYEQCCTVDAQCRQLLQQLARLMRLGRWAVGCYSLVLQQLLPGEYIEQSHHWCWSQAFTAAASGPYRSSLVVAAAVTPTASPVTADVARTWACLVASWTMCQLLHQQQHAAEVAAATAPKGREAMNNMDSDLTQQLTQLAGQLGAATEAESAQVQLIASKALGSVCEEVGLSIQQLHQLLNGAHHPEQRQLPSFQDNLQQGLAALQVVLSSYQQAGLSFILDLTSSTMTDELPEAAATLDELLDQHDGDDEQLQQALHEQEQKGLGQQYSWINEAAEHLQVTRQLLSSIKHEALPALAAWEAAAATMAIEGHVRLPHIQEADMQAADTSPVLLLQAGPVSQVNLWTAAARCVGSCWQELQQQLQYAQQLEQQIRSLAAIAAVGGAARIAPEDTALLAQAETLHQQLMPQGYDISYEDDCATAAQLLQLQWREAEQAFLTTLASGLCPLLGLTRVGLDCWLGPAVAGSDCDDLPTADAHSLNVLQQLLAAAAASISSRAIMHGKDVFEALEGASGAGNSSPVPVAGSSSSSASSNKWGRPDLSTAWRNLVVLLLQCGCTQQHNLSLQQQDSFLNSAAPAVATEMYTINSSSPLPLDFEQYRPLVFVVEVLHQLFDANRCSAATAPGAGSLFDQVEDLLRPALLRTLLQPLQHHLTRLRQHLQALSLEAESVLNRHQHLQQRAAHEDGQRPSEPGTATADAQLAESGFESLVPFDAFDPFLPGADMLLEDEAGLGGLDSSSQGVEQTADLSGSIDGAPVDVGAASSDKGPAEEQDSDAESGLDWLDQEALQQQQERGFGGSDSDQTHQPNAAINTAQVADGQLPDLVPFDAFDPDLAGADALLEDVLGGNLEQSLVVSHMTATTLDEGLTPASLGSITANQSGADESRTSDATAGQDGLQWQSLGRLCWVVGQEQAGQLLLQQSLVGLQQEEATCAWQQQLWFRHLAAFEWIWEDVLGQQEATARDDMHNVLRSLLKRAGSLSDSSLVAETAAADSSAAARLTAAAISGSLCAGAAYQLYLSQLDSLQSLPQHPDSSSSSDARLVPTRQQLLAAWQEVAESSPALESDLSAWHAAVAANVASVRDVIISLASSGDHQLLGDSSICVKVLSGLCARCKSWCSGAVDVLISLTQLSEAAVQLEYSRRGTLWAPGAPAGVDAFQGNAALLANLQTAIIAVTDAEAAATAAEMLLASSQTTAQQAELTIEDAAAEEAVAEQELVLRTPAALARAQGLPSVLNPMVQAADSALNLVSDNLSSMFRALSTLVERNSAARDLTPIVAETAAHLSRCVAVLTRLRDVAAAAAGGLQDVLQQQQQRLTGDEQHDQQLLLQLLLTQMQPAVQGVQDELRELGQAHILLTQLTQQLDSLAAAAQTVSAAITAEHAVPLQDGVHRPNSHTDKNPVSVASGGSSIRKQRADARRRAFAAAALSRCSARLTAGIGANGDDHNAAGKNSDGSFGDDVAAEVSHLISQATSLDRLCRMYEGWMPWL